MLLIFTLNIEEKHKCLLVWDNFIMKNNFLYKCDARRKEFDGILVQLKGSKRPETDNIHLLLSCLLYFYSTDQDTERLVGT